ncbi:hypothetical protein U1Q18_012242 [Sarracenia purpurea var. burkii]
MRNSWEGAYGGGKVSSGHRMDHAQAEGSSGGNRFVTVQANDVDEGCLKDSVVEIVKVNIPVGSIYEAMESYEVMSIKIRALGDHKVLISFSGAEEKLAYMDSGKE